MNNKYIKEALDKTAKTLTFEQEVKRDWQKTYDLGYKHGFEMGQKEYQIKLLQEELDELQKNI